MEMGDESGSTEYAIKRVGGVVSYKNPEAAETYIRARRRNRAEVTAKTD